MLELKFYGVRGSTPCSCPATQRYGGNTSCVLVDVPGQDPIIFDLGTGARIERLDKRHGVAQLIFLELGAAHQLGKVAAAK